MSMKMSLIINFKITAMSLYLFVFILFFVLLRLQLKKYKMKTCFKCSSALHPMWRIQCVKPRLLYSVRREPQKDMLSFRK